MRLNVLVLASWGWVLGCGAKEDCSREVPYDGIDQDCDGADMTDLDGDGFPAPEAGGSDCDDADRHINPNAEDVAYDGIDQNCDGSDLRDVDGDGTDAEVIGGDDCDDFDPTISPAADEIAYDHIDQDCDGMDLTDVDGDGFDAYAAGGLDCDDTDPAISPTVQELPYDGIDQDCDGVDPTDLDGDGFDAIEAGGADCDDADSSVNPSSPETRYDGIDQDCDGGDLTDNDHDGFDATVVGGDDCNDNDPWVYPGATETAYDNIDQDCDGHDLKDADGDGVDGTYVHGLDCDDLDASVYPDAPELPYDGIDQDCDGADLVDVDGDRAPGVEAGGDDCDDNDPSISPAATDTPYDAIDQDCSGADLTDVDADGHDALVAGGDDCEDERADTYPGATENPYDGIDQDCTGADLTDVDGDGFDAEAAGGDDCDDDAATAFPGGTEELATGIDEDCDGRTDEYLVCPDGSGDFTTIQDAADGVPAGSTLELCPGTYLENSDITTSLTIEGGGDLPTDVVLTPVDITDWAMVITGGATVELSNVSFRADVETTCRGLTYTYAGPVDVHDVDFCMCDHTQSSFDVDDWYDSISVTHSKFCQASLDFSPVFGDIQFSGNVVEDVIWAVFRSLSFTFENNVVSGGDFVLRYYQGACDYLGDCQSDVYIRNNTFADLDSLSLRAYVEPYGDPMPRFYVESNIFANSVVADGLYYVHWWDSDVHFASEAQPALWSNNVVYNVTGNLEYFHSTDEFGDYTVTDTGYSAVLEAQSLLVDPMFAPDPGGMGSYALDPSSPAVDVGRGYDADGTPADLGAFGGENSDWWMEVPWQLP